MERSPLASLSPELRNHIYELSLYERRPVAISPEFSSEASLLRTCKQIREEAQLLFYSINDFTCVVKLRDGNYEHLPHWLRSGPREKLSLVRSLTIRIEMPTKFFDGLGRFRGDAGPEQIEEPKEPFRHPIIDCLRRSDFGSRLRENVIKFSVNGMDDEVPFPHAFLKPAIERNKCILAMSFLVHVAYWDDLCTAYKDGFRVAVKKLLERHDEICRNRARALMAWPFESQEQRRS